MLRLASERILRVSREVPHPTLQVLPQFSLEKVDHYNNPRNVGSFNKNDPMVSMGLAWAPACGDGMKLHLNGAAKSRKIVDARFKTFGCGLGIASSSAEIVKHLSSHPFKLHRLMFAEDAIKAGVKSYEA